MRLDAKRKRLRWPQALSLFGTGSAIPPWRCPSPLFSFWPFRSCWRRCPNKNESSSSLLNSSWPTPVPTSLLLLASSLSHLFSIHPVALDWSQHVVCFWAFPLYNTVQLSKRASDIWLVAGWPDSLELGHFMSTACVDIGFRWSEIEGASPITN